MPLRFTWPIRARPNSVSIMCRKRSPGATSRSARMSRSVAFHQNVVVASQAVRPVPHRTWNSHLRRGEGGHDHRQHRPS